MLHSIDVARFLQPARGAAREGNSFYDEDPVTSVVTSVKTKPT